MTSIYICSERILKPKLLSLFRIKHLFILDSKGNRYEVQAKKKRIKIGHKKVNLKKLLNNEIINYKIIKMSIKTFLKRLRNATQLLEGKQYKLFTQNCYNFVKSIINYPLCSISISLIGNLK